MRGIHVFEKRSTDKWTDLSFAVQVLSILSWKTFHGSIHLYTNEAHLTDLKEKNIHLLYDSINTSLLNEMPKVDKVKYWAFEKLWVAANQTEPFTIIDTDLWFEMPLNFNPKLAFQGFHYEAFDPTYDNNIYLDFDNWIPSESIGRWNKQIMPINTAILSINDLDFAKYWFSEALTIAQQEWQLEIESHLSAFYMTLVEQRLLPLLGFEWGLAYGTLTPQIYLTYAKPINGNEWFPNANTLSEAEQSEFYSIKHIWGLKKFLVENPELKKIMATVVTEAYNKYPEAKNYHALLKPWTL